MSNNTLNGNLENAFRASQRRVQIAANAACLGLFEWDLLNNSARWENHHIYEIFERSPEDGPLSKEEFIEQYLVPADRNKLEEVLQRKEDGSGHFQFPCRILCRPGQRVKWLEFHGEFERDELGNPVKLQGVLQDVTAQKRREHQSALLTEISENFTRLTRPEEIFNYVSTKMAEYLQASNCLFVDIDEGRDLAEVSYCWNSSEGTSDLKGKYALSEFVNKTILFSTRFGQSVIVEDTQKDMRVSAQNYAGLGIRSFATIPFIWEGKWEYLFTVTHAKPRQWLQDEVDHLRKIANLICLRIERARTEEKLKSNESKLQMLFQDAPALITLHKGTEHWFVFSNQLHDKVVGNRPLIGKTLKEAMPELEGQGVFEKFNQVFRTGQPLYTQELPIILAGEKEKRYFYQIVQPWFSEKKEVTGVMTFAYEITEMVNSRNLLRDNERRLQMATTASNLGIFEYDIQNGIVEWDRMTRKHWGVDPDIKITYEVFLEGVHPEDRFRVQQVVDRSLDSEGNGHFKVEYRVINRSTGDIRWIAATAKTYFNGREPVRISGTVRDITEEMEAKLAKEASEERYSNLFNIIDEGFAIVKLLYGEDGQPVDQLILSANPAFEKHSGYKAKAGLKLSNIYPQVEQYWNNIYDEVIKTGRPKRVEEYSAALDRWFYVNVTRIGEEKDHKVAVLFSDSTSRKKTEQALRESEERFRLASEAAGFGTYDYDVLQDKIVWSPEAYRIYDIPAGEEVSRAVVHQRLHPDDREVFNDILRAALNPERAKKNEGIYRITTEDGDTRWIRDVNKAFHDSGNRQVIRVIGTIQDITGIKAAEEALMQASRRKDEFLATLSHELRNPLTPVMAAMEIMRNNKDEQTEREAREIIERQIGKLVRLIDDLMDIARITRDKIKLQKEEIDLRAAADIAVETAGPLIEAENHSFRTYLPQVPIYINADLDRLTQVITNLLTNAAKYTPSGGKISLRLKAKAGRALILVEDNGVGLSKDETAQIFDIFRQVGDQNVGLGIGLSLVKKLVEMHQGTVSVHSEGKDRGCTFTVSLPLIEKAGEQGGAQQTEAPAEGSKASQKLRVLVVDDNEDVANIMCLGLRGKGFEVEKAYSGKGGLETAYRFLPQAAVLDIGLPDIEGYEVAVRLRKKFPDMLLIAHSGWGQLEDKKRAEEAGFDHHLVKPAGIRKVVELLNTELSA